MSRLIAIIAALFCTLPALAQEKPNIVLFLVDDLGAIDIGVGGSEFYLTPNVDQLAADGVTFSNAYVAFPRCTPSRFALMTGQNPARHGVPGRTEKLGGIDTTVADALKAGGYATYFLGKWHLGGDDDGNAPTDHGFDVNIAGGYPGAPGSYVFPYNVEGKHEKADILGLEDGVEGEQLTDRLTAEAATLIRNHLEQDADAPFFLELSHYGVHTPLEDASDRVEVFEQRLRDIGMPSGPAMINRDGETKIHQDNPVYAAMISRVDDSLGTITALLDELGIADNTIVVFTSDHGGLSNRGNQRRLATSNLPLRAGKGHVFEGGIKVPMIVRWPDRIAAGASSEFVTVNTDHFATFLDAAGLELLPEVHVDSVSYLPAATGADADRTGPIYWYSPRPRPASTGDHAASVIRVGDMKLIKWYHEDDIDLFDLATDPYENNDLSETRPDVAAELLAQLDAWLTEVDAVESRKK